MGFMFRLRHRLPRLFRAMSQQKRPAIVVDSFAMRQFDRNRRLVKQIALTEQTGRGAGFIDFDVNEFCAKINNFYEEKLEAGGSVLVDGYAPFCKHLFVPNFVGAKTACMPITPENEHLLRTAYEARTKEELPVLSRYFPVSKVDPPVAKYLDIILYSREQIRKECEAMGKKDPDTASWGVVSVKAQLFAHETPMQPITMMRNALGKDQGGSGVRLNRDKYNEAVSFWKAHASIV